MARTLPAAVKVSTFGLKPREPQNNWGILPFCKTVKPRQKLTAGTWKSKILWKRRNEKTSTKHKQSTNFLGVSMLPFQGCQNPTPLNPCLSDGQLQVVACLQHRILLKKKVGRDMDNKQVTWKHLTYVCYKWTYDIFMYIYKYTYEQLIYIYTHK